MPGTFLNYPFDEEIFVRAWHDQPDPVRLALISSGVMVEDPRITASLQTDGNQFTVPFYKPLGPGGNSGTYYNEDVLTGPANYDGETDVPLDETKAGSYSGVAYGRSQGFFERDFVPELTGSDPMGLIVRKIADFWNRYRQTQMMNVLDAAITNTNATWAASHDVEVNRPVFPEKLPGLINTELTKIFGVLKDEISVLLMDSLTASEFENLNLLHFERGVDANAMKKGPRIGQMLGYIVIVDDTALGHTVGSASDGYIYALGTGALMTGKPRLDRPAEYVRDAIRYGGITALVTRMRDVIHPNGFSFVGSDWGVSPSNTVLGTNTNYSIVYPQQTILMARLKLVAGQGGESGDDLFKVQISSVGDGFKMPIEIEDPVVVKTDTDPLVVEGEVSIDGPVEIQNVDDGKLDVVVTNYEDFDFSDEA